MSVSPLGDEGGRDRYRVPVMYGTFPYRMRTKVLGGEVGIGVPKILAVGRKKVQILL